ncbi:MAG: hypothetical protein RR523_09355 [Cetobacterium sp.]
MKLKNTNNWLYDEVVDTKGIEIVEENIYVDEYFIKNKSLIRMDLNLIQYPIFSKNTKRKENQIVKYFFNKNKDTFITVIPSAGNYIPGEAEEKVFIALMKIMKQKGMPRKFIITSKELKEELSLNTGRYITIIKDSLLRLSSTTYNFKNTMYSSEKKTVLSEEVQTAIMSLRILRLEDKNNIKIRKEINDNRIKEVYEICISEHFYNNIVTKGYLVYNSDILLSINASTARTIYMLIEKLRFNELYLKIDTFFLIKRIPLKYSKSHMSRTIKILESNLQELKNKKLIETFNFLKESTWEKSEVEIYFNEQTINEKQERFFDDLNDFKRISTSLAISDTEHDLLVVSDKEKDSFQVTKDMVQKIFNVLPSAAKKLKSMPKTITDNIGRHGFEKVMKAAIYLSKQKNLNSPRAYFLKTLENNWAQDIVLGTKILEKENTEVIEVIESEFIQNYEKELDYYNSLSEKDKNNLDEKVYKSYILECGEETKIQKLAFRAAKRKLIGEYILKNQLIKNNIVFEIIDKKVEKEQNILTDINLFNDYINKSINLYKAVFDLSNDNVIELKREILLKLSRKFILNNLTIEEIDKTIAEKLGYKDNKL